MFQQLIINCLYRHGPDNMDKRHPVIY